MTALNCIIIDDDEIDLLMTVAMVKRVERLKILATYSSAEEAIKDDQFSSADVLFLDIDMEGMSGIEFRKIAENVPACIFITSHPEFALDSYSVDTLDFIVKPLNQKRFEESMSRLDNYFEIRKKAELYENSYGEGVMYIKEGKKETKINIYDIVYFEALKDYTQLYTFDHKYTILCNLGNFLKQNEFQSFTRIHRSYAVNRDYIKSISSRNITMSNEIEIPIGRYYKESLESIKENL